MKEHNNQQPMKHKHVHTQSGKNPRKEIKSNNIQFCRIYLNRVLVIMNVTHGKTNTHITVKLGSEQKPIMKTCGSSQFPRKINQT